MKGQLLSTNPFVLLRGHLYVLNLIKADVHTALWAAPQCVREVVDVVEFSARSIKFGGMRRSASTAAKQ